MEYYLTKFSIVELGLISVPKAGKLLKNTLKNPSKTTLKIFINGMRETENRFPL